MTQNRLTRSDVVWGYTAQIFNIAGGLLILPVIVHYLSRDEVGLWFVFLALGSLAQLLELGFQPTVARNVAYVYAGATRLEASGMGVLPDGGAVDRHLLFALFISTQRIYRWIAAAALFSLFTGGTAYIYSLLQTDMNVVVTLAAWAGFAAGYVVNFYFGYVNGFLQGRGNITLANKVMVISRLTLFALSAILLIAGMGILALGVASLASALAGRLLAWYYLNSVEPELRQQRHGAARAGSDLFPVLWRNASRLGAVFVGAFLINRANVLIASSFLGLADAGSYGLTIQVLSTLMSLGAVIMNIQLPLLNRLQIQANHSEIVRTYSLSLAVAWSIFICGAIALLLWGNPILQLIGSKTPLLPPVMLAVAALVLFLEMNHSISATYLTSLNEIPFVKAALGSGVPIVIGAAILVGWGGAGLWGLILSQGVVQLAYNNWKWPHEVSKRLGKPFPSLLGLGFKNLGKLAHDSFSRRHA